MAEHSIKVQEPYFGALLDGSKTFEVRRNDRSYQRGDTLHLIEMAAAISGAVRPTGRSMVAKISYVYSGDPRFGEGGGLQPGFVVLALAVVVRHMAPADTGETP